MLDARLKALQNGASNAAESIPAAQARAVDRRHALDQQQRQFQTSQRNGQPARPRPPG